MLQTQNLTAPGWQLAGSAQCRPRRQDSPRPSTGMLRPLRSCTAGPPGPEPPPAAAAMSGAGSPRTTTPGSLRGRPAPRSAVAGGRWASGPRRGGRAGRAGGDGGDGARLAALSLPAAGGAAGRARAPRHAVPHRAGPGGRRGHHGEGPGGGAAVRQGVPGGVHLPTARRP